MRKNRFTPLFLLMPFLALMALVLVAIGNVLVQSLGVIPAFGLERPTLQYYIEVLTKPAFFQSVWVSVRMAGVSALVASVLGTLLCYALVRCRKTKGVPLHLLRLPILVPHAVAAVFVIQLLSQTGMLARIAYALGWISDYTQFPQVLYTRGYWGAIIAYLWKEIPFVAYFVLALMAGISDTLGEAAENLGASPARSFFHITLPLSLPAITNAFLIIFIFAFGGYELPFLLGVTLPKALPVQAYIAYSSPDLLQRPYAMAMNGIILLLSLGMALLYHVLTQKLIRRTGGRG